jgi:hypothetical protein
MKTKIFKLLVRSAFNLIQNLKTVLTYNVIQRNCCHLIHSGYSVYAAMAWFLELDTGIFHTRCHIVVTRYLEHFFHARYKDYTTRTVFPEFRFR